MPRRNPGLYLTDILESGSAIQAYGHLEKTVIPAQAGIQSLDLTGLPPARERRSEGFSRCPYARGKALDQFSQDRMRSAAVIREFEIIGEAAGKVPDNLKNGFPEVPWRDIKDFRNLLTHEYFGIDLEIVWNTINQDLPLLIDASEKILTTLSKQENPDDAH